MNYELLEKALNLIFQSWYYPFLCYLFFAFFSRDYHIYIYLQQKFSMNIELFYNFFKKLKFYNEDELSFINGCNFINNEKLTKDGLLFIISYKSYLINVKMFCVACYSLFIIIITFLDTARISQ